MNKELEDILEEVLATPGERYLSDIATKLTAWRDKQVAAELERIKADWSKKNTGDRIVTDFLQIYLSDRIEELEHNLPNT